jgi:hypothetical protein
VGGPGLVKQRVAARLLLASCTLALGLGLGTAVAVVGLLALQHPSITVASPGEVEGDLDPGVHQLLVSPVSADGQSPVAGLRPACEVAAVPSGQLAAPAEAQAGFAAVRVERDGRHRVACTSPRPVTVRVEHEAEGLGAYLAAVGRGLIPAVILTVLAALLAARALVTVRRLQAAEGPTPPS